jgi:hypothetical protein
MNAQQRAPPIPSDRLLAHRIGTSSSSLSLASFDHDEYGGSSSKFEERFNDD